MKCCFSVKSPVARGFLNGPVEGVQRLAELGAVESVAGERLNDFLDFHRDGVAVG